MEPRDLRKEEYREYDYGGRVYRIGDPETLWIGSTTHRVLAGGIGLRASAWYRGVRSALEAT